MRVRGGHAVTGTLERGSVALGMMLGVVIGLAVAVAVAVFVTRAPLPFVNKVVRSGDRIVEPRTPADAPDPNRPAASRQRASDAPAAPARSGSEAPAASGPAPSAAPDRAASVPPGVTPAGEAAESSAERTLYVLQAGAFRLADDADNMKAKLALIGLEARVQPAEVNGQRVFRVRIGPYVNLDDLNRARARLEENGIESAVVRQR